MPFHSENFSNCSFDEGPIPSKKDSVGTQITNFLAWMKLFMENNRTKANTFQSYRLHMKRMLTIWIHKKSLTSVYSLWNLNEHDLIPVCDQYVDSIDSDTVKEQAVNAYKKVKVENVISVTTIPETIVLIFRSVTLWNGSLVNKILLKHTMLQTWHLSAQLSIPTET